MASTSNSTGKALEGNGAKLLGGVRNPLSDETDRILIRTLTHLGN